MRILWAKKIKPKVQKFDSLSMWIKQIIVGNGMEIVGIAEEGLHAETVEAVESRLGSQPYIAMTVFQYGIHLCIAQSVTIGQAIEFHRTIRTEGTGGSDGEHPADEHQDASEKVSSY